MVTDPLPFVPAMWIDLNEFCGLERRLQRVLVVAKEPGKDCWVWRNQSWILVEVMK